MSNQNVLCIVCDEGTLTPESYTDYFDYKGQQLRVDGLARCRCNQCDADPILPEQVRFNQKLITDAKRLKEGLLAGDEIRRIREVLSLSQQEAAEAFGGGDNAFSKYERGDVMQSFSMDRLLRVVGAYPRLLSFLRSVSKDSLAEDVVRHAVPGMATDWEELPAVHADQSARYVVLDLKLNQPKWSRGELEVEAA